jgi:Domain of unknown function (DUF222)
LSLSKTFEGMGELTGRLDPEAADRAITVLNALSQKSGPEDDRTAAQLRADAFDTMCKAWLESGALPAPKDGSPRRDQVIVMIPHWTLLGLPGASGALLGDGTPITAETARRLACDASIRRVILTPAPNHGTCRCGHTCSWTANPDPGGVAGRGDPDPKAGDLAAKGGGHTAAGSQPAPSGHTAAGNHPMPGGNAAAGHHEPAGPSDWDGTAPLWGAVASIPPPGSAEF